MVLQAAIDNEQDTNVITDLCARVVFTIIKLIEPIDRQLVYIMLSLCKCLAILSTDTEALGELLMFSAHESQSVSRTVRDEAMECTLTIL